MIRKPGIPPVRWFNRYPFIGFGETEEGQLPRREAWLFVRSVWGMSSSRWGFINVLTDRMLHSSFAERRLRTTIRSYFDPDPLYDVRLESMVPHKRDGGVYVKFSWKLPVTSGADAKEKPIEKDFDVATNVAKYVNSQVASKKSSHLWGSPGAFLVRGHPWVDDMYRIAKRNVAVFFEGPPLDIEDLYRLMRPYGWVYDITEQLSAERPHALVHFGSLSAAVAAKNCTNGYVHVTSRNDQEPQQTVIISRYNATMHTQTVKDWIVSHPRVSLPVIATVFGAMSWVIFDPIRVFFIKLKLSGVWESQSLKWIQWIRTKTQSQIQFLLSDDVDDSDVTTAAPSQRQRESVSNEDGGGSTEGGQRDNSNTDGSHKKSDQGGTGNDHGANTGNDSNLFDKSKTIVQDNDDDTGIEQERLGAVRSLRHWLSEIPESFIFVAGPHGSSVEYITQNAMKNSRYVMTIDLNVLFEGSNNEQELLAYLASQVGYMPSFGFLRQLNSFLDMAVMSLTGEKPGFSRPFKDELNWMLSQVTVAVRDVASKTAAQLETNRALFHHQYALDKQQREDLKSSVNRGIRDARFDSLCGPGIVAELGGGMEPYDDDDYATPVAFSSSTINEYRKKSDDLRKIDQYIATLNSRPVIFIKNLPILTRSTLDAEAADSILKWAADLITDDVANVVVTSDSVGSVRQLTKALSSRPVHFIGISDASPRASLQYVEMKLPFWQSISDEEKRDILKLGGRQTDLDFLVAKMQAGQSIHDAVEDMIQRATVAISKVLFGDTMNDSGGLPWTQQQAWYIMRLLADNDSLGYFDVVSAYPFAGDEKPLAFLEQAEIVSIALHDHVPMSISVARPIYKWALRNLVGHPLIASVLGRKDALQQIEQAQKEQEDAVQHLLELSKLVDGLSGPNSGTWVFSGSNRLPDEIFSLVQSHLNVIKAAQARISEQTALEAKYSHDLQCFYRQTRPEVESGKRSFWESLFRSS